MYMKRSRVAIIHSFSTTYSSQPTQCVAREVLLPKIRAGADWHAYSAI